MGDSGLSGPCLFLALCMVLRLLFGREMRLCSEVSLLGVSGMASCLARFGVSGRAGFCGSEDSDGHIFFWSVLFLQRSVNILSFMISWRWISLLGQGVFHGMVGYLFFLGSMGVLECALGRYSSDALTEWQLPLRFDADGAAGRVAAEPEVWTDGSLVEDKVSGASSAWASCFTCRCSRLWANWRWDHLDEDVGEDAVVSACLGPLQSVQRAEFWGVILALQANDG